MRKDQNRALSQRIFEDLETRIVDRLYPPGTHLVEDSVASELGVSRTPVREAFRLLERAGWLQLRPHSGAYVRYPTVQEVREVFELRQCLEQRACEVAAERATDEELDRLRRIIGRGTQAAQRKHLKAVSTLNTEFHSTIAAAAHNQLLRQVLEDLGKQVRWHFSAVAGIRGLDSWREHEDIVEAIAARDSKQAGRLAIEHSDRTQTAFFDHLLESDVHRLG
jgi:DNA-binding GntR family transcriptional regulator